MKPFNLTMIIFFPDYSGYLPMDYSFFIIIILSVLLVLVLVWVSKSRSRPCPAGLMWMLDPRSGKSISTRTKRTLNHLKVLPGMTVLDAGCGPGRLTIPLSKAVGETGKVTALDLQEEMLEEVQERAKKNNCANITYLLGAIGEGLLPENTFDSAVLITVLGEIPDKEKALQELYRCLKPGGILLIEETVRDPHYMKNEKVCNLTEQAGFTIEAYYGNWFAYTQFVSKPATHNP